MTLKFPSSQYTHNYFQWQDKPNAVSLFVANLFQTPPFCTENNLKMDVAVSDADLIAPCPRNEEDKCRKIHSSCFSIIFEAESSYLTFHPARCCCWSPACPAPSSSSHALSRQLKYFSFLTQFFKLIFPLMFVIGVEFTFVLCIFSQWPVFHSSLENYLAWIVGISRCAGTVLCS